MDCPPLVHAHNLNDFSTGGFVGPTVLGALMGANGGNTELSLRVMVLSAAGIFVVAIAAALATGMRKAQRTLELPTAAAAR